MNYFAENSCKEISLTGLVGLVNDVEKGLKEKGFDHVVIELNKDSLGNIISSNGRYLSFKQEGLIISFSSVEEKDWNEFLEDLSAFNSKIEDKRLKGEILGLVRK